MNKVSDTGVLKPCPFCGGEAQPALCQGGGIEWAQVECVNPDCGAVGPTPATQTEAITAWNTRALTNSQDGPPSSDNGERIMADPIYSKDAQGKVVATTHGTIARHYNPPKTAEGLMEQRIKEGRIRFADDVPSSVTRLIEHLDRSAGAEGVCIDADDCAGLARDLRIALTKHTSSKGATPHG